MNLNNEIITILSDATHLPVVQDEYEGKEDKYIVFVYEDENPGSFGDNRPTADTVYLQIQLITPKHFNYLSLKDKIRDTLEDHDYIVTSITSFLGDKILGTEKERQTIFEANISKPR